MKKLLKLILIAVSATFFLVLIFNEVNSREIWDALAKIKFGWVIAACVMFFLDYSIRIYRWRLMLEVVNSSITWKVCAGPLFASFALNNILPFRIGDFARTFAFNKKLGVSSGTVLASMFVERLLDLLMVLLFLIGCLYLLKIRTSHIFGFGIIVLLGLVFIILLLLFFPNTFFKICYFFFNICSRLFPQIERTSKNFFNNVIVLLDQLSRFRMMMILIFWSLIIWTAEGFVFWLIAVGLPNISNSLAAWFALPIGSLATLIPSSPGYVGTFDYFVIESMHFLGNDLAASAALAFIVHLLLWIPPTLIGGLYLLINAVPLRSIKIKNNE